VKRDELTQALFNLVINAIEAMEEAGTLCITTTLANHNAEPLTLPNGQFYTSYVRIDIEDNGIGMNDSTQTRIFDPFFTTRSGRTGVGLAISRKIINEHGGAISVYSTPEAGSTFTLILPLEPHVFTDEKVNKSLPEEHT
jgi:signal transduction histidine kinase